MVERYGERVMITGGRMHGNIAWIPTCMQTLDGEDYVTLRASDLGLASLVGAGLRANKFLDEVQLARDESCEEALNNVVSELFACDAGATAPTKLRVLRTRVVQEHAAKLPSVVTIRVSTGSHEETDEFVVPFESDKRRCVAIKCNGDALSVVVKGCTQAVGKGDRHKKPRPDVEVSFEYPEVRMHRTRKQPYVIWTDADGKSRYHAVKITFDDDPAVYDERLRNAAEALHEFYTSNHVGGHVAAGAALGEHGSDFEEGGDDDGADMPSADEVNIDDAAAAAGQ
jgi:hypothetical protein